jgi:hypothetical protein
MAIPVALFYPTPTWDRRSRLEEAMITRSEVVQIGNPAFGKADHLIFGGKN